MYTEESIRELSTIKTELESILNKNEIYKKSPLQRMGEIYGYHYIPNYYPNGVELSYHPGKSLVEKYGYNIKYNETGYANALKTVCAQIQTDITNDNYDNINYLDYIIVPDFTWNGTVYHNIQFDVVSFNHHTRAGDTGENPKGIGFQIHNPLSITDTWNNVYNQDLQGTCATALETSLGVTLKTLRIYMGESLNNAWLSHKIYLPDEREITHPVGTYTENNDSTIWPMAIYQYCPQYKFKGGTYMLYNLYYSSKDTNCSCIDANGFIAPIARTTATGVPFSFTL